MTLHAPGSSVAIGPDGCTPATVLAVTIRSTDRYVCYEVAWWDGATRKAEWLAACEIHTPEPDHVVGFTVNLSPR